MVVDMSDICKGPTFIIAPGPMNSLGGPCSTCELPCQSVCILAANIVFIVYDGKLQLDSFIKCIAASTEWKMKHELLPR